jgi:hypothetical protein
LITDWVSDSQFARAKADPDLESPPRPMVGHADKFGPQFQGLVGPDGAEPPAAPARHPHYVGGENGASVHKYRESLDGGFDKRGR